MLNTQPYIRPATPTDFEAIYAIWLAGVMHSFAGVSHPLDLREQFHHNYATCQTPFGYWVAEEDGEIVGWQSLLACTSNPLKRHLLAESSTYIAAGIQSKGLGEALVRYVLYKAESMGLQFILGYVSANNVRAASIAKATGFVPGGSAMIPQVPPFTEPKELWVYTVPGPKAYN